MSFSSLSINQNRAINDLSKYVIGASINQNEESSGIVSGAALMGGISGSMWAIKNRKDFKAGFRQLAKDAQTQKAIVNSPKSVASGIHLYGLKNKLAGANEYISKGELEALSQKYAKKPEYAKLKTYIDNALKSGKNYSAALKDVEKLKAIENLNKYNAKVAAQTANGSTLRTIKNATGITKLSKATKQLAVKSGKFRGLLKGVKGNAAFAVISLGMGVICDVIPAFKLGKDKGFKQLGKTAAKTGAEVAGWAVGAAAGAKLGAIAGSFCGPLGTVVGGAIGLIGGFVGSYFASKVADKVIGPSEVELAEQEAAGDIAKTARSDMESLDELAFQSFEQLLAKAKAGELTEDDLKAKKALEELIGREINLEEELKALAEEEKAQTSTDPTKVQTQEEEKQGTKTTTVEQTSQPNTTAQTPQTTSPYNGNIVMNPFNSFYWNNMYTGNNSASMNPYSNDMYFQKVFGGNNEMPYQFRYQG